jgi:hypothetical protein
MSKLDYEKHTTEFARAFDVDLTAARKRIADSVLQATLPTSTDKVKSIPPYMIVQALTEQLATQITSFVASCFDNATQEDAIDLATHCHKIIARSINDYFDLMKDSAKQHIAEADTALDPKIRKASDLARQVHGDGQ